MLLVSDSGKCLWMGLVVRRTSHVISELELSVSHPHLCGGGRGWRLNQ